MKMLRRVPNTLQKGVQFWLRSLGFADEFELGSGHKHKFKGRFCVDVPVVEQNLDSRIRLWHFGGYLDARCTTVKRYFGVAGMLKKMSKEGSHRLGRKS
ncbi:unnamed protein product [Enterobius vermicularis]|uniref:Type II toxin-antitoxin system HicA family toxin n=1 Tax=Enterobius vermicularis TaxID=51028 RepID=A0A0N4V0F4_ENTVE|nr:unnamed protein product [Enterobius vermicularis]